MPGDNRVTELINRVVSLHRQVEEAGKLIAAQERRRLQDAIAAGEALLELKAGLGHGKWMPWVKQNLPGIHHRSVNRYCRLAEHQAHSTGASSLTEALEWIDWAIQAESAIWLYDHRPDIMIKIMRDAGKRNPAGFDAFLARLESCLPPDRPRKAPHDRAPWPPSPPPPVPAHVDLRAARRQVDYEFDRSLRLITEGAPA